MEKGFTKISIHFVSSEEPFQNGNMNGVGALIRDSNGVKLWGAAGPMHGMSAVQATLWGAQAGMIQAHRMGFNMSQTDNKEAFDLIRFQEFIFVPEDLVTVVSQINAFHTNHFIKGVTQRLASVISLEMNRTAQYMASYGMENLPSFVETPGISGNLQHFLDSDMGLALPFPMLDLGQIFGYDEVINVTPPSSPDFPMKNVGSEVVEPHNILSDAHVMDITNIVKMAIGQIDAVSPSCSSKSMHLSISI